MSAKAISEAYGKSLLKRFLPAGSPGSDNVFAATITAKTNADELAKEHSFLTHKRLVAKPDQLIKRRGKLGLVKVDVDFKGAKEWIDQRMGSEVQVGAAKGELNTFIVEPFVPHEPQDEHYLCIFSERSHNTILFHHQGGVDVGDVDAKAAKMQVGLTSSPTEEEIILQLLGELPAQRKEAMGAFVSNLYAVFKRLHFTYLEINPVVMVGTELYILDLAAKLDQTAEYLCHEDWGSELAFPAPFGRSFGPEEQFIADLDAKTGASLKLTILNPKGRVWTMVAGGGASVVYSDTVCALGSADELANYGEYSGAPSEEQTFEYAKAILGLMTKEPHPDGKVLIIGGGIANFTNVAATFKGLIRALKTFKASLQEQHIKVFVRRGGPNYQEGLQLMRDAGRELQIPFVVCGPESHMTAIVGMALGTRPVVEGGVPDGPSLRPKPHSGGPCAPGTALPLGAPVGGETAQGRGDFKPLFSRHTKALLYGLQPRAVQGMLDFDRSCGRDEPSVAGMVYPFRANHTQKFFWGTKEIMVPVYQQMEAAMQAHPEVDVVINFSSFRSAYESSLEALSYPQIRCLAVIAEGIPESLTRLLNQAAADKGVVLIGPATVGGIKPGCFKIGNTGGSMDNIISSKLYRPGSVAYVSRSGGMSNELNNIISRTTDGVYEGVAIGGDRYPGTTFIDHLRRYQADPAVKLLVLLGEVGGVEEYEICEAMKSGALTKPMVAWCIGTCGSLFTSEVQFGHAGACAHSDRETAAAKNAALSAAGAIVPSSFDTLGETIGGVYARLVAEGQLVPRPEPAVPTVPIDYKWAQELGLIRKPASFVTTVSDERGEELKYGGVPISEVAESGMGVGGVVGLLWFQRRLPEYACKFIEMTLMITADHGPAVSGAHNTIVAARAGKDLVSSLTSGLLTIGDRFGGALDGAARMFSEAHDAGLSPREFVDRQRKKHELILGIGHRVKSTTNPDMRVDIVKEFVLKHFPETPLLDFALEVEKITTSKRPNLILNVDGVIAVCFVDLLRRCGAFTPEEASEHVKNGCLNGLFVLGRTMGFIGHFLDQKRLKQGLYRHPWDDIAYLDASSL